MRQSRVLIDTLKRCLRNYGLTYRDVASSLNLSEASIKRVFSDHRFSLERLEAICALMNMRIIDLCRLAEKLQAEDVTRLNVDQEAALAASPALLRYFYRLLSGWAVAAVNQSQGLNEHKGVQILARLDRLGLIELLPGNKVRLLVGPHVSWRRDGPLWTRYADSVQADFLKEGFRDDEAFLFFETGELSAVSMELIHRKMARLAAEFRELVELDSTLNIDERKHAGLMLASKPWLYSPLFD